MDGVTNVWVVVAGTVGGAVAVILALFVGGWLLGRYYQRQVSNFQAIQAQFAQHYQEHGAEINRWQGLGVGWGLAVVGTILLLLVARSWIPLIIVFVLLLPASMILGGIATIKTRYYWDQPILRPLRLLTGERAVDRGRILIAAGMLILIWLLSQAVRLGITLF